MLRVLFQLNRAEDKDDFYTKLSKNAGTCHIYNGEECNEYLFNKHVYVTNDGSIALLEKKLKRWFQQTQEAAIINTECWEHAKAYTCSTWFPECNPITNKPTQRPLCSEHCDFMQTHVCKGEFKRVRHSPYYQLFLPLCEKVSLVDDSDGSSCYFLPTVDLRKGPIPFAETQKPVRRELGKSVTLKCKFGIRNFVWNKENSAMITEGTWYRDRRRVVGNERVQMKTKQKGASRLFMMLKIKHLIQRDQGRYTCIIRFGNITVTSVANLKINYSKVPIVIPHPENVSPTPDVSSVTKNDVGQCVSYKEGICASYLNQGKTFVAFESNDQSIESLNERLKSLIMKLRQKSLISKKCEEYSLAVICYNMFSQCHNATKPVPTLCKQDCNSFKKFHCKRELEIIAEEAAFISLYLPDCDTLPEKNPYCIQAYFTKKNGLSFSEDTGKSLRKNAIHNQVQEMRCYDEESTDNYLGTLSITESGKLCDIWNKNSKYANISHDYCRNFGESQPWCFVQSKKHYCSIKRCKAEEWLDPVCYKSKEVGYYGKVSKTKSGKKCLEWNSIASLRYSNVEHSYCRMYEDMEVPWCYIDQHTKEICDIPQCTDTDTNTYSSIVYIIPILVGISAIIFFAILVLFYLRNKKIVRDRGVLAQIAEKEPQNGTLSSTTSFLDEQKTAIESPNPASFKKSSISNTDGIKKSKAAIVKEGSLHKCKKLGEGRFGQLWYGEYAIRRNNTIPVLIRQLAPETRSCIISEFRKEMTLLRDLKHEHVQSVVCVSAMSELPFMAFDYKNQTDLKEFLKLNKLIDISIKSNIINQLASGVEFLHSNKIVHKDLAARNCLISTDELVQISNSGLGIYRYPDEYNILPGLGLAPMRWLSPETLLTGTYNANTDVYMFGILMWEIFSLGEIPYEEFTNDHVLSLLSQGGSLLNRPKNCPNHFWSAMTNCWTTSNIHFETS
ncbi:tyrosine-protein kinase transmembrane receptor Ror isoform X6 [Hydra vulgaris]|uniref:tyrosine-protein kinase transmembrane receptor Ror isoform X6 n=1 Tax=Hydra vulgaris TaxID=6087 RepID=UPI0032E9E5EE